MGYPALLASVLNKVCCRGWKHGCAGGQSVEYECGLHFRAECGRKEWLVIWRSFVNYGMDLILRTDHYDGSQTVLETENDLSISFPWTYLSTLRQGAIWFSCCTFYILHVN